MVIPSVPTNRHTKEELSLLTRNPEDENTGETISHSAVYTASTLGRRLERVLEPIPIAIPNASLG
jgi:hypothetical protein